MFAPRDEAVGCFFPSGVQPKAHVCSGLRPSGAGELDNERCRVERVSATVVVDLHLAAGRGCRNARCVHVALVVQVPSSALRGRLSIAGRTRSGEGW
jgi:hypothetical protein